MWVDTVTEDVPQSPLFQGSLLCSKHCRYLQWHIHKFFLNLFIIIIFKIHTTIGKQTDLMIPPGIRRRMAKHRKVKPFMKCSVAV